MLLIVRHGETALNAARVVQPADTPLNSRGQAQAQCIAKRLAEMGVERVVSSDLPRTRMTAEPVVQATGASVDYTPLLQERNFGDLRGRPYAEIGRDIFAPDFLPPAGESWADFDVRVARAFAYVLRQAVGLTGHLAVVTHGLVCRSLASQFLVLPSGDQWPVAWGNTSLTVCEATAPHVVHVLNSVAHLEGANRNDPTAPSGL